MIRRLNKDGSGWDEVDGTASPSGESVVARDDARGVPLQSPSDAQLEIGGCVSASSLGPIIWVVGASFDRRADMLFENTPCDSLGMVITTVVNACKRDATEIKVRCYPPYKWRMDGDEQEGVDAGPPSDNVASTPDSSVRDELVEALRAINRRLSATPGRNFDDLIRDAGIACDYARAAIAKATGA
ncbi:MAG: hypothetical protein Q8R02_23305 [Hyphomonadaceae bacterium]|nr:hypothetical protein [Hyphomonadaceae bacterium]